MRIIAYINRTTSSWLILVMIILNSTLLSISNYYQTTVLEIQKYMYIVMIILYVICLSLFYEYKYSFTYERRNLRFRLLHSTYIAAFIMVFVFNISIFFSFFILRNPFNLYFLSTLNDIVMCITLTSVFCVMNFLIAQKNKMYLISYNPHKYKIFPM